MWRLTTEASFAQFMLAFGLCGCRLKEAATKHAAENTVVFSLPTLTNKKEWENGSSPFKFCRICCSTNTTIYCFQKVSLPISPSLFVKVLSNSCLCMAICWVSIAVPTSAKDLSLSPTIHPSLDLEKKISLSGLASELGLGIGGTAKKKWNRSGLHHKIETSQQITTGRLVA